MLPLFQVRFPRADSIIGPSIQEGIRKSIYFHPARLVFKPHRFGFFI
jgi:hypothetical protein